MTRDEIDTLARYNSEVARGVLHTPEWNAKMAGLQARFDSPFTTPRMQEIGPVYRHWLRLLNR